MPKAEPWQQTKRDSLDFRDWLYRPALVDLPRERLPDSKYVHVRDQGDEGSCTGFGLAAVIDYLNAERGKRVWVSARMLYEMARRHDQWPGEEEEGSSARGAIKGWHKNGVCREKDWAFKFGDAGYLTHDRQQAALEFPLGAYYRILLRRSDVQSALVEVPAIFASAVVHDGWTKPKNGVIAFDPKAPNGSDEPPAGHAFAIIGYTEKGLIVQNSWGEKWGGLKVGGKTLKGCALWSYEDFDRNAWDLWAARMAHPVKTLESLRGDYDNASGVQSVASHPAVPRGTIRDHYVHIDDGHFDPRGDYPSYEPEVREIVQRAVQGTAQGAPPKHLVLYAHGGLVTVKNAACKTGNWKQVFLDNGIYPLHFIWETGLLSAFRDLLLGKEDLAQERAGGITDWWDKLLEKLTGKLGHSVWKEMRSDAEVAFAQAGAGTLFLTLLRQELQALAPDQRPKLHLVGHSAGAIWLAWLLQRWGDGDGIGFENLILFAPANTTALFDTHIRPALYHGRAVQEMHVFRLDDARERKDSVGPYRKSLLYLVSRAYQSRREAVPIMGMERFQKQTTLEKLNLSAIQARCHFYNPQSHPDRTQSPDHGGFDNDPTTMNSMLRLVLGHDPAVPFEEVDLDA